MEQIAVLAEQQDDMVAAPSPRTGGDEIDESTLRLAAAGDRAASRALVEMYQVRVFALVSRMLAGRGRATIEDAAQDTFLQVFRRLGSFAPGGAARLSTWILTIAARRAIDELRKQRPALLADVERTSDARGDDRAVRRELIAAIEGALRELSPELRAAFLLREYHGLDYAAIASALSIDLGTVKSRLSRARAALRERLAAGSQATLSGADGATVVAGTLATPTEDSRATREQLLVRTRAQQAQLDQLRTRIALLEQTARPADAPGVVDIPEPGRTWHDPSPEKLAAWVADCHVRTDAPDLDRFTPLTEPSQTLGLAASELPDYNATMTGMAKQWRDLVRSLYVETTGDTAGAETLSTDAMRREIEDKNPPGEHNLILQRVSQERAGLAMAPTDLSKTSTLERLMRASFQLGDQAEAGLARRLGPDRAQAIRGEGWGSRWELSGCPRSP